MYYIYFDEIAFPVIPKKITTKIKGGNQTVTLINGGEVNVLKDSKLTEITFDLRLPNGENTYGYYPEGYKDSSYYLAKLEKLKLKKGGFKFKLIRNYPNETLIFTTSMNVTIEDYSIEDDCEHLLDIMVPITLKKYVDYGTNKITVKKKNGKKTIKKTTARTTKEKETSYTVKSGDTLYLIAKKKMGSGSKSKELYTKNKTVIEQAAKKHGRKSSVNGRYIYAGTKLTIPKS